MRQIDRRRLLGLTAAAPLALSAVRASADTPMPASGHLGQAMPIPDEGWQMWLDPKATWQDDAIYLPDDVPPLDTLPVHPPTGGWAQLTTAASREVTLPATVEQFDWGQFGLRPYTADEYRYADDDPVPQNGAYVGISWWWRDIAIPASAHGQQVFLHIRGARLRAEVFLNENLVGYSIMSELPITCDLSAAMRPGEANRLAIRLTNPGGRYDWKDSNSLTWGHVKFYESHGFGGLDRGLALSLHPRAGRIGDAWVLNVPEPRTMTAHLELELAAPVSAGALKSQLSASLMDDQGQPVAADVTLEDVQIKGRLATARFRLSAPTAKVWDLDTPNLYRVQLVWCDGAARDSAEVRFGFRWYSPEGIGSNAMLRLNGHRIKAYSAISWGYWGYNGLWPTPELARREVTAAKTLGLNALSFHRNVGKREVLDRQDEMGLLRSMEPGAGRQAIGRDLKPGESLSVADRFSRDFMVAKCKAMVRAFRSHPSLVHYTLQNEVSANLSNPDVEAVLAAMHALDPSRTVILNDGFVGRGAAQAMFLPYDDHYYRSDVEKAGGWWVNHQGAGDQWYDKFYVDKDDFVHRETMPEAIVEFGEMEGCAVCDDHVRMVADILQHGGHAYDLADHQAIIAGAGGFLDQWGFREAFPTTESYFLAVGQKQYDSWQNYLENIRICDQVDMAAISGWESTAIENHSGIVDNLRYFHADPARMSVSLMPVRPVAKQRRMTYAQGEAAELDLWLLNDTGAAVTGRLHLSVIDQAGQTTPIGYYDVPAQTADVFSYLVAEKVMTPVLKGEGAHTILFELEGRPGVTFRRQLWVVDTGVKLARPLRIAVSGIATSLRDQLSALPGVTLADFTAGGAYDAVIASGLKADEIARRQIGDQTGNEAAPKKGEKPPLVLGQVPDDVLEAVSKGLPLLVMAPEDGLADGIARQLSQLGLFGYSGQVGDLRAPWMGNWNVLRRHPVFSGIPTDCCAGLWHQIEGPPSNGLRVAGEGIEIIAAYSRDHDRLMGAASFRVRKDKTKLLFHRMPDMVAPLQTRFLINALNELTDGLTL
ncbi:sugar-binding domain-containing protein [Asticcacaulis sp. EMRT-3]|uniref:sugar-binding domain-containing protein n=1 Tax=Asticcacaulis sp. EMRT-3 TaxID=3040349 RepID=UPI0024AECACB|nr:sugar-binding domain-containing protein [Asticcacaulis sp. EMRT-3]MDI7776493.1 hypothetical protein [Asticcacaulis sp. EMRT-3]